ncbi:MAG: helix-turn-helix domain-containing protein [Flavobacteriales bacterium]|nr:helix-turn-helix domain-containing protein [Flavobacteriales bacterium]MCW8913750.1 helix-turn-helix domain-containing protein [Flavobacteriales bacterium]MCW8938468.1 helix-turn-helix domain-containing protein [Flavobacteriales bacterium]MCW8967761.1 helix-turn-helix domain-containing protein [Flavobacteriales bacterium]MCW8989956.1 helix-turn-helix domain-containing protein [Flavobacteriales bacterium]
MKNELKTILMELRKNRKEVKALKKEINQLKKAKIYMKHVLTIKDASEWSGLSESFLYHLTSTNKLTHSKPNGKVIFIHRRELKNFLLSNEILSNQSIEEQSANYLMKKL